MIIWYYCYICFNQFIPHMKNFILTFSFLFIFNAVFSQLTTETDVNSNNLVEQIFLGYGIDLVSVNYIGDNQAFGSFNYTGDHFPIYHGLIMTTGTVFNNGDGPQGPNDNPGAGATPNTGGGSPILNSLLGADITYNSATLEVDFIPLGDSVFFNYIFASEEYLEYVNGGYNDAFGLFLSGPGITGEQNIALLPNMSFVSIDNVNSTVNSDYYIDNGDGTESPYDSDPSYIQYDGFTTTLTASATVIPDESYHLTIVVADVNDPILDSGIFLEGQSLRSNPQNSVKTQSKSSFKIYPNPAEDKIRFTFQTENQYQVILKDAQGKIVKECLNLTSGQSLDISELETGVYFIELSNSNEKFVEKISKR